MLSGSTLLLIAVLWAVVLVPRALRDLRSSPQSTVTGFSDAMARLAMCDQRLVVVPAGSGRRVVVHPRAVPHTLLVRRRRAVLARLVVGTVGTLAVAVVLGGPLAWAVAGLSTVALLGYCAALRTLARRRVAERRQGSASAPAAAPTPVADLHDPLVLPWSPGAVAAETVAAADDPPWPAAAADPVESVHDWHLDLHLDLHDWHLEPAPALAAEGG